LCGGFGVAGDVALREGSGAGAGVLFTCFTAYAGVFITIIATLAGEAFADLTTLTGHFVANITAYTDKSITNKARTHAVSLFTFITFLFNNIISAKL